MVKKKNPPSKKASDKSRSSSSGTRSGKTSAPKKKTAVKKSPSSRRKKAGPSSHTLVETIATVVTTVFFVLFALFVAYVILHPREASPPARKAIPPQASVEKKAPAKKTKTPEKPAFEIYPVEPVPSKRAATTPLPKATAANQPVPQQPAIPEDVLPKVAIIIDDFGYDLEMAKRFIGLDGAITCAVLPHSTHGRKIALLANAGGHEVMLHQPMEPNEYPSVDPGPGALLASMAPDERITRLRENIEAIPGVRGVNNHMGSKLTTLSDEMNQVFTVLKGRGLFFVDSRTTSATVTQSSARLFRVPYAERDVFLDHVREASQVRAQIEHLLNIAEIHGKAVGIGHPYEITYRMLKEALPMMKKRVHLVPASEIVEVF